MELKDVLAQVADGTLSVDDALNELKKDSYEDLSFAKIDHSREARIGFPEVIFGERKTPDQVAQIAVAIYQRSGLVLGTRADAEHYDAVKAVLPDAVFYENAKIITVGEPKEQIGNVAICTAGTTDIPVAEEAALTAWMCGAEVHRYYDVGVAGIHRLLDQVEDIRKANAIVTVAGMEGALASVIGGLVNAPIVACPTSVGYGANFGGLSALLAMLNSCAAGTALWRRIHGCQDQSPDGKGERVMRDEIFKLETNLDDCTGETLAYCMEKLFEAGAKDVWYTPIFMKKGRPAYALSVMCREDVKDACIKVIFRETSAIGMRVSLQVRVIMDREAVTVDTPYGPVDAKHLTYEDIDKTTIEYESAKKLAEANNIPLSEILK